MQRAGIDSLAVADAAQSLAMIEAVFDNQPGPARDIVCLNAGAAIYAADLTATLQQGVDLASEAIASGKAKQTFAALIKASNTV
jgi:anthranilate phosphoribosyltransferase